MTAKSFRRAVLAGALAGTALLGLAGSASASDTAGYIGDGYANNSRAVWCVQHLINDVARNNNRATIDEDSIWGPRTKDQVLWFQAFVHVQPDGIVGPFTGDNILYRGDQTYGGKSGSCFAYVPSDAGLFE
ncbi:peptidoglycan-binding domain-containing protein [Streptomyces sp. NPDC001691]|uniref:peptidoglycan-binding domain-containing protein n=1 Tax=unclassified Streptomyces TaxID=2593676 RepID=UPI000DEBA429|nr:peptidoglycan-binding domain-containing protein [Streptomyces sp. SDr-06]RCH64220.1 peptidoglycan-binding protein [Streptomyces sp. SDr-06]